MDLPPKGLYVWGYNRHMSEAPDTNPTDPLSTERAWTLSAVSYCRPRALEQNVAAANKATIQAASKVRHMVTSYIYMPKGMDDSVVQAAKSHFAEEFGGFTVVEATGGWQSPSGDVITEDTEVVEVAGMPNHVAERTAEWLANRTDETEVMFQTVESEVGFASGDD